MISISTQQDLHQNSKRLLKKCVVTEKNQPTVLSAGENIKARLIKNADKPFAMAR
jgi:hypothetical protein